MPGFETELEIERAKTVARWFGIAIVAAFWYRETGLTLAIEVIIGAAALVNLFHTIYLARAGACPGFYKYLTTSIDLLILTAAIRYTGSNRSPLFYVYFVLLISNCIRYGLLMSIYIAALVNIGYAIILAIDPMVIPSVLGGEGLKILAFWGVALYGGSVAARIRRQAFEIAAYEDTIEDLRTQLRNLMGGRRES